jgi:alkanesulfonate monooxygenase SsuD/methylene tetrahydromethanopterin reductase-like flavin-dependent oxidoreductase (luciferase family)
VVGIGAGYLEPEFRALGAPFHDRGARTNEAIEVLRALWTQEKPAFAGRFFSFSGIDAHPRPVQKPHPPIVVGGTSPQAFARAVRQGHGWYGFAMTHEDVARCVAGLAEAARRVERPATLGRLEVTVTPRVALDPDAVLRFEDLGVDRLVPMALGGSADDVLRVVGSVAKLV